MPDARYLLAGLAAIVAVHDPAVAPLAWAADENSGAIPFAPPLDQPFELDIESLRTGLRGEPVTFRSRYAVSITRAGRGLVADLTLHEARSSVEGGDALFAAVLGPLVGRPARFLIGDAGRTITMVDADAYWAAFAAASPSEPGDAAAARAAIVQSAGGAETRARMLSSPLHALFILSGRADMADQPDFRLLSRDADRAIWEQQTRSPPGEAIALTTVIRWTVDVRTGLTLRQEQETHRDGPDGPLIARQTMRVRPTGPI